MRKFIQKKQLNELEDRVENKFNDFNSSASGQMCRFSQHFMEMNCEHKRSGIDLIFINLDSLLNSTLKRFNASMTNCFPFPTG